VSIIGAGFEAFSEQCRRLGIAATLAPASRAAPSSVLGQPLEPTLVSLYAAHDGTWWFAPEFELRVYPLAGPDALEWRNHSLRRSAHEHVPPYPFDEMLVFAQYGAQADRLATIPALADAAGRQPVIYLDLHEDPWAVPVASSVDGVFDLLAQYIDRATTSLGRAGLVEIDFPLDVGDLIAADDSLRAMIASGSFEGLIRGDSSIREWMSATFG
jgi:hypothetical protein